MIVGNDPAAIAAGDGSVWVANSSDGTVTQIDPTTLDTATIPVGHGPAAIAVNAAGVWVANAGDDTVVRVDPDTNAVVATYGVGNAPAALLATPTAIWVANSGDGTVMRLDPRSGERLGTKQIGGTPDALAFAGGRVWVAVAPPPPSPPATGGTAHLTAQSDPGPLDPAVRSESPDPVRDLREPRHVSGQARPGGIARGAGGRGGGADPDRRRDDVYVQDPSRLPLLATVERARHGSHLQVDDRAGREPAPQVVQRRVLQRHRGLRAVPRGQGARALGRRRARKHAHDQAHASGRRLPHESRPEHGLRRAAGHAGPAAQRQSPRPVRTTSSRTRRASRSFCNGIRTTTATARTFSIGSCTRSASTLPAR